MLVMSMITTLTLYFAGYFLALLADDWPLRVLGLWLSGFACVQAAFIGHEAGHGAITRDRALATAIGRFFMSFLTGMSYTHFQSIHRRHHPHCNRQGVDPDMETDLFALYPAAASKGSAVNAWVARRQWWLLWVLVSLQGLSLKWDSLQTLRRSPRTTRAEQAILLAHLLLWLVPPALVLGFGTAVVQYLLTSWFIGPYLGSIFPVNHIGRRVWDKQEGAGHFFQQLASTRNLGKRPWQDWYFGGLNNHIEHHLFPSIPKSRLAVARRVTRDYCREQGLAYHEVSWLRAMVEVTAHLRNMGSMVSRT